MPCPKRSAASAAADVAGAPARRRIPSSRALIGAARSVGSLERASRMTQARWPSSFARRCPPARRRSVATAAESTRTRLRSAQASAFWTSGSSSPISWRMRSRPLAATIGSRPRRSVDERHGRDGAADEAALPARRRVDELLELRPAVRLVEDALAGDVGEGVDRDPVRRPRGRPAGGAARSAPARPRSCARACRRRTSAARAAARGGGDRRRRAAARAIAPRRLAEAALDGLDQRPANADARSPIPGAIRRWPSRYSGSARVARPVVQRRGRRLPGRRAAPRGCGRGPRRRACARAATNATARWVTGLVGRSANGRRTRGRAHRPSLRVGDSRSVP